MDLAVIRGYMVLVPNPIDLIRVTSANSTSIQASSPSPADDRSVDGSPSKVLLAPNVESSATPPKLELTPEMLAPFYIRARLMPLPRSEKTAGDAKGWAGSTRNHDRNAASSSYAFRFCTGVSGGVPSASPGTNRLVPTISF